jgi:hypothetical protein
MLSASDTGPNVLEADSPPWTTDSPGAPTKETIRMRRGDDTETTDNVAGAGSPKGAW